MAIEKIARIGFIVPAQLVHCTKMRLKLICLAYLAILKQEYVTNWACNNELSMGTLDTFQGQLINQFVCCK